MSIPGYWAIGVPGGQLELPEDGYVGPVFTSVPWLRGVFRRAPAKCLLDFKSKVLIRISRPFASMLSLSGGLMIMSFYRLKLEGLNEYM